MKTLNNLDMNKILLLLSVAVLFSFNSCIKELPKPEAGNIPGMGNAGGELQAEAYEFHEDLVFGEIKGVGASTLKSASVAGEESTVIDMEGILQGSGDQVVVTFTITNTSETDCVTAYFRAGTVFAVNQSGYQNAILLAPVVVCLEPNTSTTVTLYLYCVNLGLQGSDGSASYEILGVTTSELMLDLIEALENKMINYDHYVIYGDATGYQLVQDMLQEIVWHITNGTGLTDDDFAYIYEKLDELPNGVYPEGIYIIDADLPECWCSGHCRWETAWGGNTSGVGNSWWLYYDVTEGGEQIITAGQNEVAGATVKFEYGYIIINLGSNMELINDDEAVKIQGYNADDLPTKRPNAGHFDYKGTDLKVYVGTDYRYYAIHLDVKVCD